MIAFLGMGLLGSNFVKAFANRGEIIKVWNRTYARAKALSNDNIIAFEKAADAVAEADFIHLTLKDDHSVNEVLDSIKGNLKPNAIIIDHTTTSVEGVKQRTEKLKVSGFRYIHAPVFMGPQNALEGTGYMLVSGDPAIVNTIELLLSAMTGQLVNLGPEVGKAAAMKLLGNSFLVGLTGALTDTLALAKALHTPIEDVVALLRLWNPGGSVLARIKKMTDAKFDQPTWELNMARKDTGLFLQAAKEANVHLSVLPGIAEEMDKWISKGYGQNDWTVIAKPVVMGDE